jgi:hypothetical protein
LSKSLLPGFDHSLLHEAALFSSDNIITVDWFKISEILAKKYDYNSYALPVIQAEFHRSSLFVYTGVLDSSIPSPLFDMCLHKFGPQV